MKTTIIGVLVILISTLVGFFVSSWNEGIASKEHVYNNYISKEHASQIYLAKSDGEVLKKAVRVMEIESKLTRETIKELSKLTRESLSAVGEIDKKLDMHLVLQREIISQNKRPPPPPEDPPVSIVNNED